ncbi:MAG: hypothetical protein M3299_09665 [Thermoproteota archaeon]|nr:hypothetical protein [Thermoproteota archaeon]
METPLNNKTRTANVITIREANTRNATVVPASETTTIPIPMWTAWWFL